MKCKVLIVLIVFCLGACGSEDGGSYASEKQPTDSLQKGDVSFMHISDTHGSSVSVIPMVEALNSTDCDFGIISGDILPDAYMMGWINRSSKPIFLIPGNHDIYEGYGQYGFRENAINKNTTISNVSYGNPQANYYSYDIKKNNYTLRVIALDQFEHDAVERLGFMEVIMSQTQIDWFIHVLEDSYSVDGIIVIIHEGFGNKFIGQRNVENTNNFISSLAADFPDSYDFFGAANPLMIPEIVEAYLTGDNIVNRSYPSGADKITLNVTTNFKGQHHNFIAYFGGHLHWDEVEYLNSFPNQLIVLIAFGGNGTGSKWNDLIKIGLDSSYNINYNVVDFEKKKFTIHRLGAKETISGVVRDSIAFDILK